MAEAKADVSANMGLVANALTTAAIGAAWGMALRPGAEPLPPLVIVLGAGSTELGPFSRHCLVNWLERRAPDAALAVDRIWRHLAKYQLVYEQGFFGGKPDPKKLVAIGEELIKLLARSWPSPAVFAYAIERLGADKYKITLPVTIAVGIEQDLAETSATFAKGSLGGRYARQVICEALKAAFAEVKAFAEVQPYDLFNDLNVADVLPPAIFSVKDSPTIAPAVGALAPRLNAVGLDYGTRFNAGVKINKEGLALAQAGKTQEAAQAFQKAAATLADIDRCEWATGMMNYAGLETVSPEEAAKIYEQAGEIYRRRKLPGHLARLELSLGSLVLRSNNNYEAAVARFKNAVAAFQEIGDKQGLAESYRLLAKAYDDSNNLAEAPAYAEKAIALTKDHPLADDYIRLATVQMKTMKLDEARTSYESAVEIAGQAGDKNALALANYGIGLLEQARKRDDEARTSFTRAQALYEEIGAADDARDCEQRLVGLTKVWS